MADNLNQITELVLDVLYSSTQRDKIRLEIEYVDDMYKRRLELARNDKEKEDIEANVKSFIKGLNGTMVLPGTKDGVHYILISKAILNEKYFMGTIIHELTHIYDFMDFASEFCDGNYESLESHHLFEIFCCWTEFNARRNGYSYYRKILFRIAGMSPDFSIEEQLDDILNKELKFHYEYLLKEIRENKNNMRVYVYNIIQFMGRFSIWEDLFPDKINSHDYLPDYLQNNYGPRIIELYETFHSMVNFDIAKGKLEQLESLMDSLF